MLELQATRETVMGLIQSNLGMMKPGRLYNLTIKAYRRPRTTGPKSQNSHAWGHIQQLAEYTGHDVSEIGALAKLRAVKRGYPADTFYDGTLIPWSQSRLDTAQCAHLIDELHQIADELGIILREV